MDSENLGQLKTLQDSLFHAFLEIGESIMYGDTHHVDTLNVFGDKQLSLDVLCDDILFETLKKNKAC